MSRYDIAIIGMGGVFPGANGLQQYLANVVGGASFFKDMPEHLWQMRNFCSLVEKQENKSYTMRGAFLDEFQFPHEKHELPQEMSEGWDRAHLVLLEATRQALGDALLKPRTEELLDAVTIIGTSGLDAFSHHTINLHSPKFFGRIREKLLAGGISKSQISDLEESFNRELARRGHRWDSNTDSASNLTSSLSSRTASLLGIGGLNMTVDGACASSFVALDIACQTLMANDARIVLAGGVDLGVNPSVYVGFSRVSGLSQKGISNPFDQSADGLVIGEGAGVVVLKRLEDAIADGDTIRAVIRGVGSSSDGAGQAIYAPALAGRVEALQRALVKAELQPSDVQYLEAHATSTPVGDGNEYDTISTVYGNDQTRTSPLYLGSVKGQIGHLKAAAGMAGLIKTVMCMEKGHLPHMPNFKNLTPHSEMVDQQLVVPSQSMTWQENERGTRVAAVTASGFGGVNYHTLIEHADGYQTPPPRPHVSREMAIVGAKVRTAKSSSRASFWENITEGNDLFTKVDAKELGWQHHVDNGSNGARIKTEMVSRLEPFKFDLLRHKIFPKAVSQIAPTQLLGLDLADQLLVDAGLSLKDRKPIGVSVGAMHDDYYSDMFDSIIPDELSDALTTGAKNIELPADLLTQACEHAKVHTASESPDVSEHTLPGWMCNVIAGRMANKLNLSGANFTVDTSFSSGIAALIPAMYQLMFGDMDSMITGGVNRALNDVRACTLSATAGLATTETRPFDKTAEGFLLGEGGALYLLKRLADAKRDGDEILGVVNAVGGASNTSIQPNGFPSQHSIQGAMRNAFRQTNITPRQIGVIDAHGMAKPDIDLMEAESIAAEIRPAQTGEPVKVTATSSHLGNLNGGSGSVSMLSIIQSLRTKTVPSIRNLRQLQTPIENKSGQIRFLKHNETIAGNKSAGGVLSLGFAGGEYFAIITPEKFESVLEDTTALSEKAASSSALQISSGFYNYLLKWEPSVVSLLEEVHERFLGQHPRGGFPSA